MSNSTRIWRPVVVISLVGLGLWGVVNKLRREPDSGPTEVVQKPAPVPAEDAREAPTARHDDEFPAQRAASSLDLLDFIPTGLQIAAGADFVALCDKRTPGGSALLQQFSPVTSLLARMGIEVTQIEQLWTGCNRKTGDMVTCVRTRSAYNAASVMERLPINEPQEKVGHAIVRRWTTLDSENAVAFLDARTLLVGREATVKAALMNPAPGPVRWGLMALAQPQACYWIAGDDATGRGIDLWKLDNDESDGKARVLDHPDLILRDSPPLRGFAKSLARSSTAIERHAAHPQVVNYWGIRPPGPKSKPVVTTVSPESVEVSMAASYPSETGAILMAELLKSAVAHDLAAAAVRRTMENVNLKYNMELTDAAPLPAFFAKAFGAGGNSPIDDGLFVGTLSAMYRGLERWTATYPDRSIPVGPAARRPNDAFGWMTQLLPYIGHDDLYRSIDFTKGWGDPFNRKAADTVIPAFLNPADPRATWDGAPHPGVALTHFAGMAGVEDARDVVAGELPRSDPRAGIFGYDRIATANEITDGLGQTIMVIGTGELVAPWAQGGGATIRGARQPYFDRNAGFGSRGLSKVGTYVLFADGSARIISASIDPTVFKALCTMHGNDLVNLPKPFPAGR